MRRVTSTMAAIIAASALAASAGAQTQAPASRPAAGRSTNGDVVMSQQSPATKPRPPTAATNAYKEAATQLQLDMGIPYSGDADKDFAALLAAYHKGAAAIAKIELQHGTDPEMRRLAEKIVSTDEKEMKMLHDWQGKHR